MNQLKKAIGNFKEKKIFVLGDIFLDKYTLGNINRLNPDHHAAPLVNVYGQEYILGGAANVANNISSLGGESHLVGVLGKDLEAKIIKGLCSKKNILNHLFEEENPTLVKQRVIAHNKQVVRLDFGEENLKGLTGPTKDHIYNLIKENIKHADALIFSDYNKTFFRNAKEWTKEIISLGLQYKIPILSDIKPENYQNFFGSSIISPNLNEAEKITQIKYSGEKSLEAMAKLLNNQFWAEKVIITCGEKGVFGYDFKTKDHFLMETKAVEVADQTGAGDTFIATMALAVASGLGMKDSLKLSNYASGIVVGKVGTATISPSELELSLNNE